jgi:hypothetical protein
MHQRHPEEKRRRGGNVVIKEKRKFRENLFLSSDIFRYLSHHSKSKKIGERERVNYLTNNPSGAGKEKCFHNKSRGWNIKKKVNLMG